MKRLQKGFTLVELLIVIALIAILSVAVLTTINPIEQTNKATDAKNKNDASEILAAQERYFAGHSEYPWNSTAAFAGQPDLEDAVGFHATHAGVGICGGANWRADGDCATDGLLIETGELKPAFRTSKSFLTTTDANREFYLYKALGSSGILQVCFIPLSNANRVDSERNPLWLLSFDANDNPSGVTEVTGAAVCPAIGDTGWEDKATACFACVP